MKKTILALLISIGLTNSVNADTYLEGRGGLVIPVPSQNEVGNSVVSSLALGWDAKTLRLETELLTNNIVTNKGKYGSNEFKAISINAALAPFDLGILKPYSLVGVGYSTFDGSAISKDKDNSLLFNTGLGLDLNLTKQLTITTSYRYFFTYDKVVVDDKGKNTIARNNVLLAGIRYNF